MRVLIAGGAGFIGSALARKLRADGHATRILDRAAPKDGGDHVVCDLLRAIPAAAFAGVDGVVNLAGARIDVPWTPENKKLIRDSRVFVTRNLVDAMAGLPVRPSVLVNASAVGIYGDRGEAVLHQDDVYGEGFLAEVCKDWEAEAKRAAALGMREVRIRTALVVGAGGLLERLLPVFRLGLGGPIGSGRQWFPWVHIDDIVGIYAHALTHDAVRGAVDTAAPGRVRNRDFARELGRALHRPAFLPVPKFVIRRMLGEFGDSVLASQNVSVSTLLDTGYVFAYPELPQALAAVLRGLPKK